METWPSLKWSEDEKICGHIVSNQVDFYEAENYVSIVRQLKLPNIINFSISPGKEQVRIAAFVPEKKGPAFVRVFRYPQLETHTASKSFYKAQDCNMKWNSNGTSLLIMTHTDEDKSGKSYYGETSLYFLSSDGKFETNVALKQNGPIHDCCWSPSGRQFLVTYGFMPSQTTLFDQKCKPIADIGQGPRNTIKWSHHERLVCLSGFGNISGNIEIWETKKLVKISSIPADYASSLEWSPNSHFLLTGVLFPRMKVDNNFKLWKYDGTLLYTESKQEIYQASWRPSSPHVYPPPRVAEIVKIVEELPKPASNPSTGKYIPPHLVGKKILPIAPKIEDTPMKYSKAPVTPVYIPKDQGPPGDYPDSPKKKKKKKAKKDGENEKTEQPATKDAKSKPQQAITSQESKTAETAEKKLKLIQKKLRQIDSLKEQQAKGMHLDQAALDKIATEDQLRKELNEIELE